MESVQRARANVESFSSPPPSPGKACLSPVIVMLPLGIFRAAVFAEPSVTEIEEVIGLIHGTALNIRRRSTL